MPKAGARVTNPKVGLLIAAMDTDDVWRDYIKAFKDTLVTTVAAGNWDQQPPSPGGAGGVNYNAAAQQLVRDQVDIIVTAGNLAAKACADATNAGKPPKPIPVVVAAAGDFTGLQGKNWTGCYNGQVNPDILEERLKRMLRNLPPNKSVAVVGNDTVKPVQKAMSDAVVSLREKLPADKVYRASFTKASDFQDPATIQGKLGPVGITEIADVLLVCSDPLMRTHGSDFVAAAKDHPRGKDDARVRGMAPQAQR